MDGHSSDSKQPGESRTPLLAPHQQGADPERVIGPHDLNTDGCDSDIPVLDAQDPSLHGWPPRGATWREAALQLRIGLPLAAMNLLDFLTQFVSLAFVGHLGSLELAGAAMAASFANVTGYAVLEGLAGGMETLCGQAFGARQLLQLGVMLQRVQVILLVCCVPIAGLWLAAPSVLLFLGQDPSIAEVAGEYIVFLIPGLFATAAFIPVNVYMQSQNVTLPPAAAAGAALALHVAYNFALVYGLGLGLRGAALAYSATCASNLALLVLYLRFLDCGKLLESTWPGWSLAAAAQGWPEFFALALPACAMICLEWWFFEIMTIMSGWLPDPKLAVGTMTICFQTAGLCYMLPMGLGTATSVRVGNELGAGRPGGARRAYQVSILVALLTGGALALALLVARKQWALIFAPPSEAAIVGAVAAIMPSLVLSNLGIGLTTVLSGVLRGSGQQLVGSIVNGAAFYIVALPSAYLLAFWPCGYGVQGLWWGLMLGVVIQITSTAAFTARIDWQAQTERAAELVHDVI